MRSVDDHEIGPPGPVTKAIQSTFFDVVRGRDERWTRWLEYAAKAPHGLLTSEIGLSAPWLEEREEELVLEALRSGRLSLGPMIDRFERALAEQVGAPMSRRSRAGRPGSTSLSGWPGCGPGDEVITTPFSFVASANCILYEGATPVFADIDPQTLNLDPAAVEAAITPRTKAILAVDIFGYPAEYESSQAIAERHGARAHRRRLRGARRRVPGAACRLARRLRPSSPSIRTSR